MQLKNVFSFHKKSPLSQTHLIIRFRLKNIANILFSDHNYNKNSIAH